MRFAFVIYDRMTTLDFIGALDALTRLKTMGFMDDLQWDVCALTPEVTDASGLRLCANVVRPSLGGYDMVLVPGGCGSTDMIGSSTAMEWIGTAGGCPLLTSVCTGSLILGAAGFLKGLRATTHYKSLAKLGQYGATPVSQRVVDEGRIVTAAGVTSSIDLGLYLCQRLAGAEARAAIARQMEYHA